jgi:hypothetical protein
MELVLIRGLPGSTSTTGRRRLRKIHITQKSAGGGSRSAALPG